MSISQPKHSYSIIHPRPEHFEKIQALCRRVYPFSKPWNIDQLESHRSYFPDGQLIVLDDETGDVVGMAFSLIISWNDYLSQDTWQDFTSSGYFHNHNPRTGKTLYGAEVMVDPSVRGQGLGKMLYEARKKIVEKYKLKRIRAGARLRGYSKYKDKLTPAEYAKQVVEQKIYDPTLSFQLSQGFKVIDVAANYLFNDPESLGHAAVIEWLNPKVATTKDYEKQRQSIESFMSGNKFVPEHLPRELRRMVRRVTVVLGKIIQEYEGEQFLARIEYYQDQLKKMRNKKEQSRLVSLLKILKRESKRDRLKIAHAFAVQLELVNVCETAYRSWRQRMKPMPQGVKSKLQLTYVLTAHPTEARSKVTVDVLNGLEKILSNGFQSDFLFDEDELTSKMRMLWLQPLSKKEKPSVIDEADYIFPLIFSESLFDFILSEKPSYEIRLRSWVGGDKDGHPHVNRTVMRECFAKSRRSLLAVLQSKLDLIIADALMLEQSGEVPKTEIKGLMRLRSELSRLLEISAGDGNRLKAWKIKFKRFIVRSSGFVKKHHQTNLIKRLVEIFPGFVFPIELREDSSLIKRALDNKTSTIAGMLEELVLIAGSLPITSYAQGMIISNCESSEDISAACKLVRSITRSSVLPVIPLFETKEALKSCRKIVKTWLQMPLNRDLVRRYWSGSFEVMLGYSDSAKQIGALPSRFLIANAMWEIEKVVRSFHFEPRFFHGSGGSVARGGGSLKEQIAWWSDRAIAHPKMTIQGEMIQRQFATKEILNSLCNHMATEAMRRKSRSFKPEKNSDLSDFVTQVAAAYHSLVNDPKVLNQLLDASPFRYLDVLKIGSRPSRRSEPVTSTSSLRAIPWVLCWTQTRLLLPTWWGIGTAWKNLPPASREKLVHLFTTSPFFSSFIKTLAFTLAKVELDVWELYFGQNRDEALIAKVRDEHQNALRFVQAVSQQKDLMWHRPWLGESIRLRASTVHILNLLQIIALESDDEALLKESIVGIASGMLTTG